MLLKTALNGVSEKLLRNKFVHEVFKFLICHDLSKIFNVIFNNFFKMLRVEKKITEIYKLFSVP